MTDSDPTPSSGVVPEVASRDPEAPEADVLEQSTEVGTDHLRPTVGLASRDPEASEGDLIEQSLEVPIDDEDR